MFEQVLNFFSAEGNKWKLSVVVMVLAFVVYANTRGHGYVQDDMAVITHNKFVQQGFDGLGKIFSTPSLSGFTERQIIPGEAVNDIYRPISLVLFATEHQLFGADAQAAHFISILLFVLCSALIYRFLLLLFRDNSLAAFAGALLFVVHPVHTEVVANIKSNDELLSVSAGVAAMLLFAQFVKSGRLTMGAGATVTLFLSLLSKETTTSFVALIPITCLLLVPGERRRVAAVAVLCVTAFAGYMLLRTSVLNAHNANHPELIGFMENPLVAPPAGTSATATAIAILGRYIMVLFVPYPLAADRTFASIPFSTWADPMVWGSMVLYAGLAFIGALRLRNDRTDKVGYAILFYLMTIALFSNLAFLTGSIMADRFLFLPSIALSIGAGAVISVAGKYRGGIVAGLIMVACLYAGITVARNADWKDNYSLCTADLEHYPNNARLHHTAAYLIMNEKLSEATSDAERTELVVRALEHYRASLAIYPEQGKVCTDMAQLFQRMGQYDSARLYIQRALVMQPGNPTILSMLGGVYFVQGQYQRTLELCHVALKKMPADIALQTNIAMCHVQLKAYDSVAYYCEKILSVDPANTFAKANLDAASAFLLNADRAGDSVKAGRK